MCLKSRCHLYRAYPKPYIKLFKHFLTYTIISAPVERDSEAAASIVSTCEPPPTLADGVVTTTTGPIHPGSEEFPYEDIATMERMVNSAGWKVPVEPGQELERLLKACLKLAKSGAELLIVSC